MRLKLVPSILLLICSGMTDLNAGPPFNTDDPEPVGFRHWEYYVSSVNTFQAGVWAGTSPHLEANYGIVPNVQVHLLVPLNYIYSKKEGSEFGYADTELGVKFRFLQETDNRPQAGIFPIVEVPTVRNSTFSNGKTKIFLPVWLQKSFDKLTTYGGAGYWINPGYGNKNWVFAGWELQYEFSEKITLGGELIYHTSPEDGGKSTAGFNLGGIINPSEKFHIIFSFGRTVMNQASLSSYVGLLWTI